MVVCRIMKIYAVEFSIHERHHKSADCFIIAGNDACNIRLQKDLKSILCCTSSNRGKY